LIEREKKNLKQKRPKKKMAENKEKSIREGEKRRLKSRSALGTGKKSQEARRKKRRGTTKRGDFCTKEKKRRVASAKGDNWS